jgi:hypothetical protein
MPRHQPFGPSYLEGPGAPPHLGPHHPHQPGHVTRIAYQGSLTRVEAGEKLSRLATELLQAGAVDFEEIRIDVPALIDDVHVRVEYPHPGRTVMKFELHFNDEAEGAVAARPISDL